MKKKKVDYSLRIEGRVDKSYYEQKLPELLADMKTIKDTIDKYGWVFKFELELPQSKIDLSNI